MSPLSEGGNSESVFGMAWLNALDDVAFGPFQNCELKCEGGVGLVNMI